MRFLSLAGRNMKEIYRDPVSLSLGLALPATLLLLFISIGDNIKLEIFSAEMLTPAVIIFSFAFLIMFSATLLTKDRQSAFLSRLLTTPLKSSDFILSYTLPFIPMILLQIVVGYAVGAIFGIAFNWSVALTLIILVPIALACVGLGMILGSLFNENQIAAIGSILITVISIFSGIWMDLDMVGGAFKAIGYALPFAHAVNGARAIMGGSGLGDIASELVWVFSYTLVLFAAGILLFRWRMRR